MMHVGILTKTCIIPKSLLLYRYVSLTVASSNYYKVLDIQPNATNDEIKKAYLQKCKEYHPDRNKGSKQMQSKFVQANEAYNVLSNVNKRREYDARQKSSFYQSPIQSNKWSNQTHSRPEDVYRQYQNQKNQEWSSYSKQSIHERWQKGFNQQSFSGSQQARYGKSYQKFSFIENRFMFGVFVFLFLNYLLSLLAMRTFKANKNYPDPYFTGDRNFHQQINKNDRTAAK